MNPVSMLIFNALVRRQGINLPQVGSLKVIARPPFMEKKNRLAPPTNEVIYAEVEYPELPQIVTMIAQSSNRSEEEAQTLYETWKQNSTMEDGTLIIETVGKIEGGVFYATEELHQILNPINEPQRISRQMSSNQILTWFISAVVIGGALSWGAITLLNQNANEYPIDEEVPVVAQPAPTLDTVSSRDTATDAPLAGTLNEEAATPAPKPASTTTATSSTKQNTPAQSTSSQPASKPTVGQTGYYVVVGTYSTEANANKFIREAKQKNPELSFFKLPLRNGKQMVYTSVATSEAAAQKAKQACAHAFKDAWIYKQVAR